MMVNISEKIFVWYNKKFIAGLYPTSKFRIDDKKDIKKVEALHTKFKAPTCTWSDDTYRVVLRTANFCYYRHGADVFVYSFPLGSWTYILIPHSNTNHFYVHWERTAGFCFTFNPYYTIGSRHPTGYRQTFPYTIISFKMLPIFKPLTSLFRKKKKAPLCNTSHFFGIRLFDKPRARHIWHFLRVIIFILRLAFALIITTAIFSIFSYLSYNYYHLFSS